MQDLKKNIVCSDGTFNHEELLAEFQADSAGTESSEIIAYIQCTEDIFHPSLKYRGETVHIRTVSQQDQTRVKREGHLVHLESQKGTINSKYVSGIFFSIFIVFHNKLSSLHKSEGNLQGRFCDLPKTTLNLKEKGGRQRGKNQFSK